MKLKDKAARKLLNSKDRLQVKKEAAKVLRGDLYRYLHEVGDDQDKREIEDNLLSFFSEKTFRSVVAIFKLSLIGSEE
jgi:hypothetical protein